MAGLSERIRLYSRISTTSNEILLVGLVGSTPLDGSSSENGDIALIKNMVNGVVAVYYDASLRDLSRIAALLTIVYNLLINRNIMKQKGRHKRGEANLNEVSKDALCMRKRYTAVPADNKNTVG